MFPKRRMSAALKKSHAASQASPDATAAAAPPADRRGPLRPGQLVAARRRLRGELVSYTFCALDGLLLLAAASVTFISAARATSGADRVTAAIIFGATAWLCLIGLRIVRAYGFRRRERPGDHLLRIAASLAGVAAALSLILVLADAPSALIHSLAVQVSLSGALLMASHVAWLALVARWRQRGMLTPNVVVVGANENARRLIERALRTGEVAVLGVFDDRHARAPKAIAGVPVLGDTTALVGHRIMPFVDRVVITVDPAAAARFSALVDRLSVLPNDITLFVDWNAAGKPDVDLDQLVDAPLSRISGRRGGYRRMVAKRLQDLAFGVIALALTSPAMLIIALAVKLDSPGPVFFRQRRQGFNNEPIVVWKFRSLHHDLRDEGAQQQVYYGDRRVTRIGRLIRATSLDELPQLFNVLAGEMSLVGPRPHAPGMKTGDVPSAQLVAHYAHRHKMKPGMTGWAAIHGSRGPLDNPDLVRRRVELDIAYIERQSFWLDLYIMVMTLPCLLGDRLNPR